MHDDFFAFSQSLKKRFVNFDKIGSIAAVKQPQIFYFLQKQIDPECNLINLQATRKCPCQCC